MRLNFLDPSFELEKYLKIENLVLINMFEE